jgi:ABC-2 type transport system permease protein
MTTAAIAGSTPAQKVFALARTEVQLVLRNRTLAVSALLVPIALGVFWAFSFGRGPEIWPMVVSLQLAVTFGMGLYIAATQTIVARRHSRVLKRMRTSGISDGGLLAATLAPSIALSVVQLLVFAVIDGIFGMPLPADLVALLLAVPAGMVMMIAAALATSVVTPSPERGQITTLPLVFVMLGAAIAVAVIPAQGWLQALVVVPGAGIGMLTRIAFGGDVGLGTLLGTVVATVSLLAWAAVFGYAARTRFRWDPRNG